MYVSDPSHNLEDQPFEVKEHVSVEEVTPRIVERKGRRIKKKEDT